MCYAEDLENSAVEACTSCSVAGGVSALSICPPGHCSGGPGGCLLQVLASLHQRALSGVLGSGGQVEVHVPWVMACDGYTPHVLSLVPKTGQLCALLHCVSLTARCDGPLVAHRSPDSSQLFIGCFPSWPAIPLPVMGPPPT